MCVSVVVVLISLVLYKYIQKQRKKSKIHIEVENNEADETGTGEDLAARKSIDAEVESAKKKKNSSKDGKIHRAKKNEEKSKRTRIYPDDLVHSPNSQLPEPLIPIQDMKWSKPTTPSLKLSKLPPIRTTPQKKVQNQKDVVIPVNDDKKKSRRKRKTKTKQRAKKKTKTKQRPKSAGT